MTRRRSLWLTLGLMLSVCLAGCETSQDVAAANDRLREKVFDLEKQVKQLKGQMANLQARVREAEITSAASEELLNNTPRVAAITIGSLSHLRDNNGDGKVDESMDHSAIQNIPTIETCQNCHRTDAASDRCTTCHAFHPNKNQRSNLLLYLKE